jgi:hypothetical protein
MWSKTMSCNGACYINTAGRIVPEGIPYRGPDIDPHMPTAFTQLAPYFTDPHAHTAREFAMTRQHDPASRRYTQGQESDSSGKSTSYMVRYELFGPHSRNPGQNRASTAHDGLYCGKVSLLASAGSEPQLTQLEANIIYASMLMAQRAQPDYSLASMHRQLWEHAIALGNNKVTLVTAVPEGHLRAYLSLDNSVLQNNNALQDNNALLEGKHAPYRHHQAVAYAPLQITTANTAKMQSTPDALEHKRSMLEDLIRKEQAMLN